MMSSIVCVCTNLVGHATVCGSACWRNQYTGCLAVLHCICGNVNHNCDGL